MATLITVAAGTLVTVTGTFENTSGTPTDPTTITLKYAQGATFAVTTLTYAASQITRTGTGVYTVDLDTTDMPGTWIGTWIGTGTCQVAESFTFIVTPTNP